MVVDRYSLSPLQQGMVFHHVAENESGVVVEQIVVEYEECPDVAALETAWRIETQRHSVLSTAFRSGRDGKAVQELHDSIQISIARGDRILNAEQVREFLRDDRIRGSDLEAPPLMRLTLLDTGSGRYDDRLERNRPPGTHWQQPGKCYPISISPASSSDSTTLSSSGTWRHNNDS
jgi:iturin family lipopeptide synthetase B